MNCEHRQARQNIQNVNLQEQLLAHQLSLIALRKTKNMKGAHKFLTDAVTCCIATDMLPISIVDNHGFRELVSSLNPQYDMPYKDHFSRLAIPLLYVTTKEYMLYKIITEIENFSAPQICGHLAPVNLTFV